MITSTSTKVFAPGRERTAEGWLVYDRSMEQQLRRQWFVPQVFEHPAKANLLMLIDIINYVSEPGDMILDPMAGTGTIMVAARAGRYVCCMEIEDYFHTLQQESVSAWETKYQRLVTLLRGNCLDFLPLPGVDHIIFSPPYADALKTRADLYDYDETEGSKKATDVYQADTVGNFGRLPPFMYTQQSAKLYKALYDSTKPGGTMTVIIKELIKGGKRVPLTTQMVRVATAVGFQLELWEKREAVTGMTNLHKVRGEKAVADEDIVAFRRLG